MILAVCRDPGRSLHGTLHVLLHKTTSEKHDYRNVPPQGFIASME